MGALCFGVGEKIVFVGVALLTVGGAPSKTAHMGEATSILRGPSSTRGIPNTA